MKVRAWVVLGMVGGLGLACGRSGPVREAIRGEKAGGGGGGDRTGDPAGKSKKRGDDVLRSLTEIYGSDGCDAPARTGAMTLQVEADGAEWGVPVWIPDGGGGPREAVVLLHGGGGSGKQIANATGYLRNQKRGAYLLVAPMSATSEKKGGGVREEMWNNGRVSARDRDYPRDDVAFLDQIVARIEREACVKKVLGSGFSDGAAMNMAWLCRSKQGPDAFVGTSALFMEDPSRCTDRRPLPFRLYMGGDDTRNHGKGEKLRPDAPNPKETVAFFAKRNGCEGGTETRRENKEVMCTTWKGCEAPTELCIIDGMAHEPPGGPPERVTDLGQDGWAFFRENAKR